MNGITADDERLFGWLRAVTEEADPVPESVLAAGRSVFGLRRLDAALAELVRDSWEERDDVLAVRGEGDVRLISFETGPVAVELQITARGGRRNLIAQVSGIEVAAAVAETPAGRLPASPDDTVVTVDGVPSGLVRLRLSTLDGREVVTSWVRI